MNSKEEQNQIIEDIYYQIRDPSIGLSLQQKRVKLKNIKQCFQGCDLTQWLIENTRFPKFVAEQIGQNFLDRLIIRRVEGDEFDKDLTNVFTSDASLFRFTEDEDPSVLNYTRIFSGYLRPHIEIVRDMTSWMKLCYDMHLKSDDPNSTIDFNSIMHTKEWKRFVLHSVELQTVQPGAMKSPKERTSFFINIFRLLIFHSNVQKEKVKQMDLFVRNVNNKWNYLIGGLKYSISDVEHGILRANARPFQFPMVFTKSDPRRQFSEVSLDPRIHFVLMNTSPQSPIYDIKNIATELQEQTKQFLMNDEIVKVNVLKRLVILPRIFRDYRSDFGKDQVEVLQWITKNINGIKRKDFLQLLEAPTTIQVQYSGIDEEETILDEILAENEEFVVARSRSGSQSESKSPEPPATPPPPEDEITKSFSLDESALHTLRTHPNASPPKMDTGSLPSSWHKWTPPSQRSARAISNAVPGVTDIPKHPKIILGSHEPVVNKKTDRTTKYGKSLINNESKSILVIESSPTATKSPKGTPEPVRFGFKSFFAPRRSPVASNTSTTTPATNPDKPL